MAHSPLLTIAIPTRNRVGYLRRATASALAQTLPGVEVLVSDNASTDATGAFLSELEARGVRVLRQTENLGMTGNWNALLAAARGRYFVLLSDDDWLDPQFSEVLTGIMEASSRVAFAYCTPLMHDQISDSTWQPSLGPPEEEGIAAVLKGFEGARVILPSFTVIRTRPFQILGGYRTDVGISTDWAACIALAFTGTVACAPSPLGHYLHHQENLSNHPADLIEATAKVCRHLESVVESADLAPAMGDRLRAAAARWLARQTTSILAKQVQLGEPRAQVLAHLFRFRRYLLAQPFRSAASVLLACALPRGLIAWLRRMNRARKNRRFRGGP